MKRKYFISRDLQDLKNVEHELEEKGLTQPQIHILSNNDAALDQDHLPSVSPFMRQDVVHEALIGAVVGVILSSLVICFVYFSGLHNVAGWVPFIFLAVVILGFCTWEGGFLGFQKPHYLLQRFEPALKEGKHVLFVDIDDTQDSTLKEVVGHHQLEAAGESESTPSWIIAARNEWRSFLRWAP